MLGNLPAQEVSGIRERIEVAGGRRLSAHPEIAALARDRSIYSEAAAWAVPTAI